MTGSCWDEVEGALAFGTGDSLESNFSDKLLTWALEASNSFCKLSLLDLSESPTAAAAVLAAPAAAPATAPAAATGTEDTGTDLDCSPLVAGVFCSVGTEAAVAPVPEAASSSSSEMM